MSKDLIDLVESENIEIIKEVIGDSDLSVVDAYGDSTLHIAVLKKNKEIVGLLLNNNINANIQNNQGKTPLHFAAEYGFTEIAEMLIKNGGNLDIEDTYGNEPLWTAVFNDKGFGRRIDIIKVFLENGANKNHKNKSSLSPADFVQKADYKVLHEILL